MSQILTFLGEGGIGHTRVALATAQAAAQGGRRVLLVGAQAGRGLEMLLGDVSLSSDPVSVATNLSAVQLRSTALLERAWAQAREVEAEYVRTPFFKEIYAQELAVLPGMDQALVLDALRRLDASGDYDCIVLDGPGDLTLLRTLGIPEVASWYWRRASQAFLESDLAKALRPFAEPLIRSVSTIDFSSLEDLPNQIEGMSGGILEAGRQAIADPERVLAHLITTADPITVQTARYLWGSAQMVGLTVGSVWVAPTGTGSVDPQVFDPLPLYTLPELGETAALQEALRPILNPPTAPPPLTIDEAGRQVTLFIPGFQKAQIELSQSGPEITITAGDQRRNLYLPPSLATRQVSGAKFQEPYLIISFG